MFGLLLPSHSSSHTLIQKQSCRVQCILADSPRPCCRKRARKLHQDLTLNHIHKFSIKMPIFPQNTFTAIADDCTHPEIPLSLVHPRGIVKGRSTSATQDHCTGMIAERGWCRERTVMLKAAGWYQHPHLLLSVWVVPKQGMVSGPESHSQVSYENTNSLASM